MLHSIAECTHDLVILVCNPKLKREVAEQDSTFKSYLFQTATAVFFCKPAIQALL